MMPSSVAGCPSIILDSGNSGASWSQTATALNPLEFGFRVRVLGFGVWGLGFRGFSKVPAQAAQEAREKCELLLDSISSILAKEARPRLHFCNIPFPPFPAGFRV